MYLNRDTRRTIQIAAPEFKSEGVGIAGDLKLLKVADQSHTEVLCKRADSYTQVNNEGEVDSELSSKQLSKE
jgi:hypothetical protein